MIRGFFDGNSPYVEPAVQFDALGETAQIPFLLDTGAIVSVLSPRDTLKLRIDITQLAGLPVERNLGFGGEAHYVVLETRLSFRDTVQDAPPFVLTFPIRIAIPTPDNLPLPSILGMDFIRHFRLTLAAREGQVDLDPLI